MAISLIRSDDQFNLTKVSHDSFHIPHESRDAFVNGLPTKPSYTISNRVAGLLSAFSGLEAGMENLLASVEHLFFRHPHKVSELRSF